MHRASLLYISMLLMFNQNTAGQKIKKNGGKIDARIEWPIITQTAKPWARWWWMGSAVNKKDLAWNIRQYSDAGLGGLDIIPIYGVHGYEREFINYLSPRWMGMLDYTLEQAQKCKLGIDMANGSGWIFGGPWITDKDAAKTVFYKTYFVGGGESLNDSIKYIQKGEVRTANNLEVSINKLILPVSANKDMQSLALDKVTFPGSLPLQLLMAYSTAGSKIDLTNKIDSNGKLNWIAPPGKWNLYALFEGIHGKMVERPTPGGEGFGVDPFSSSAMHNYFKKFNQAFEGHNLSHLRALFNDSYELDDESGQANWTPLFFSEFQKRNGYDLRNFLPALLNKDLSEINKRVIYDYRMTMEGLLLRNFTMTWKKWAGSKGLLIRNQAHGSPGNILDLYGESDIPECEGAEIMNFKFASSASHVSGKKLTSAESITWLNEHFCSSLADVKKALDQYFLGGVNHIFYHGIAYSPKNAAWPGWMFYAAVHFQPTNPQWKDFHALNDYVARCQSFLQNGTSDNNVLLYYPLPDRYSDPGNVLLRHFSGTDREFEGTDFMKLSEWMLKKGYSFDFFSDRQLMNIAVVDSNLRTGRSTYEAILLPANNLMEETSFQKLIDLAQRGARILFYKNLPAEIPGLSKLREREKIFHQLLSQLHFQTEGNIKRAKVGKGFFLLSDNIEDLLKAGSITREALVEKDLQYTRRKNRNGYTYFILNRSNLRKEVWIPLSVRAKGIALFDPLCRLKGKALYRTNEHGRPEVFVQLQPFASCIIVTYNTKQPGELYPYYHLLNYQEKLGGPWNVEFIKGGPVIPHAETIKSLVSWTDLPDPDLKRFSGTAKYTIRFPKPKVPSLRWLLDLGNVKETAEVFINKKTVGTFIGPVFQIIIDDSLLKKDNLLEINVSNLMANRIIDMDKRGIEWKKFYDINFPPLLKKDRNNAGLFDASKWEPFSSGLLGPISLKQIK